MHKLLTVVLDHVGTLLTIVALVGVCFIDIEIVYWKRKRHVRGTSWSRDIILTAGD